MAKAKRFVICALLLAAPDVHAGHTLTSRESRALRSWLATQPTLRLATAADCACAEDVAELRKGSGGPWVPVRDYAPYVATGDFNNDGQSDFAVVVLDTTKPRAKSFVLLVFNGPLGRTSILPAFLLRDLDMRGAGLFFGAPRPKPYRLVFGTFASEGRIVEPVGSSYRVMED